jgi:hypothetical protein
MTTGNFTKKLVRLRMQETGENYTRALRFVTDNPAEYERLRALYEQQREADAPASQQET